MLHLVVTALLCSALLGLVPLSLYLAVVAFSLVVLHSQSWHTHTHLKANWFSACSDHAAPTMWALHVWVGVTQPLLWLSNPVTASAPLSSFGTRTLANKHTSLSW
uniref:Putative secreted protein n=1 Tax=Amblyomma cajennense TaxID=34607 RepID=A0A023FBY5_AMBCJ